MTLPRFTPADRLCAGCGRPLYAPMLVAMETTPLVTLVAAVHRASCADALIPAVEVHDGERYALGVVTTNPEVN
jgi:hypothetical protein